MLEVARPGVGWVGIEDGFKLGDEVLELAIVLVGLVCAGVLLLQGFKIFREEVDDAAHYVGSGFYGGEIAGGPIWRYDRVRVCGEDGGVRVRGGLQAMVSGVHEETAGGAYVGFLRREGAGGCVEMEGWVLLLVVLCDCLRGVCAVVEEEDDLVGIGVQGLVVERLLEAQGIQCAREDGLFIARGDDDAGSQLWVRRCGDERLCEWGVTAHEGRGLASWSRWLVESLLSTALASHCSLAQRRSAPW